MKSAPKTILGLINQVGKQSKELETKHLVDASYTSANMFAAVTKIDITIDDITEIKDKISYYYSRNCNCDSSCVCAVDPETLYMSIANQQPDVIKNVFIGGHLYSKKDRTRKIYIGRMVIETEVWKIEDGVLKVLVPYLFVHANYSTGCCEVISGGIPYSVPVCNPITTKFRIHSAWMTKVNNYPADVYIRGNKVRATFGHATQTFCLVLEANGTTITDTSTVFYRLNENGDIIVIAPTSVCDESCTFASHLVPYEQRAIINPLNMIRHITLVFPNYGVYSFEIMINAVKK